MEKFYVLEYGQDDYGALSIEEDGILEQAIEFAKEHILTDKFPGKKSFELEEETFYIREFDGVENKKFTEYLIDNFMDYDSLKGSNFVTFTVE